MTEMVVDDNEKPTQKHPDWDPQDIADLTIAKEILENPELISTIASLVGIPIEFGISRLPNDWEQALNKTTTRVILKATSVAITTLGQKGDVTQSHNAIHKLGVFATGAVGGFFGLLGTAIELPLSTTIVLRSIAEIARSEGHDLSDLETRLHCVEVFAFGGRNIKNENQQIDGDTPQEIDEGYWITRTLLGKEVSQSINYLAGKMTAEQSAPQLAKLITKLSNSKFVSLVAQKFGINLVEMIGAKAVPVIGGVAGGGVNVMFMNFYQRLARAHFIILRLEKKYGFEYVKAMYKQLKIKVHMPNTILSR